MCGSIPNRNNLYIESFVNKQWPAGIGSFYQTAEILGTASTSKKIDWMNLFDIGKDISILI